MDSKFRVVLGAVTILLVASLCQGFPIEWVTGPGVAPLLDMGGNPIIGSFMDDDPADYVEPFYGYDTGGFLQLIQDYGPGEDPDGDGNPDGIDGFDANTSDGLPAGAYDVVVGWSWVGEQMWGFGGDPLFGSDDAARNGKFSSTTADIAGLKVGNEFYIRFYDSPTPDWDAKAIPTSGYYGEVDGFELTQGNIDVQAATFSINGSTQAETPVPEPGTLALFGLGAMAIGLRRKFAKK